MLALWPCDSLKVFKSKDFSFISRGSNTLLELTEHQINFRAEAEDTCGPIAQRSAPVPHEAELKLRNRVLECRRDSFIALPGQGGSQQAGAFKTVNPSWGWGRVIT